MYPYGLVNYYNLNGHYFLFFKGGKGMVVFSYIKYQDSLFSKKQAMDFLPSKSKKSNKVSYGMRAIDILKSTF